MMASLKPTFLWRRI